MYRCLLIDHDDTCVDSTRHIHYPAHLEILRRMRPGHAPETLEGWFEKNYSPGVYEFYTSELNFSAEEMEEEFRIWRSFTSTMIPRFFPGMLDTLKEYRRAGGLVAVVSHSESDLIRRDYEAGGEGFMPDLILGWENDPERRKPGTWPAIEALRRFDLPPESAAVLDDLLPGIEMAEKAGIDALGAGWGHRVPLIERELRRRCSRYFPSVAGFRRFLLEKELPDHYDTVES